MELGASGAALSIAAKSSLTSVLTVGISLVFIRRASAEVLFYSLNPKSDSRFVELG